MEKSVGNPSKTSLVSMKKQRKRSFSDSEMARVFSQKIEKNL